ncbi:MAG: nuclear transport factor 2 family protein, partial [Terracoccus sp.]
MTTNEPAGRHQGPETLCARFTALAAAGDLDGIVGLYADDAVVTLPLGREAAGPRAIRAAFASALAADAPIAGSAVTSSRIVVAGDLAMTSATGPDGQVRTQVARRCADGQWVWIRDSGHLRDIEAALPARVG